MRVIVMAFREIDVRELMMNPMTKIAKEWMLITAGTGSGFNTMTASWGHLGSLWGRGGGMPTSVIFIRPQRYTKAFVDREAMYTLCFFSPRYKAHLSYLGSHSGRDEDKVARAGLTPVHGPGYTYFDEASLVMDAGAALGALEGRPTAGDNRATRSGTSIRCTSARSKRFCWLKTATPQDKAPSRSQIQRLLLMAGASA